MNDSMCLKDIVEAKKDITSGKLVFCTPMSMGTHQIRQEKPLTELCKTYNLVFDYEMFGCIVYEGQTEGCYGAYMDKAIEDKYGKRFKKILLAKADSILLANNDTIVSYLCDRRPQIQGKNDYEMTLKVKVPEKLRKQLKSDKDGDFPFMDIGFYIDKSGTASGYSLSYFRDADNKSNQTYKDELYMFAVEQLKEIKHWEIGIVIGQSVNTENNIRVYF